MKPNQNTCRSRESTKIDDYDLPRFESIFDLTRWSGLSERELLWLAGRRNLLGKRSVHNHYSYRLINKSNGNHRLIEAPKAKLKSLQRDLLNSVVGAIPPHPSSHGFHPGRSIISFAKPHTSKVSVLKMDLQNFFPSISAARVYGVFQSIGYATTIAALLTDLCVNSIRRSDLHALFPHDGHRQHSNELRRAERRYSQRHLPQGAPTSPMLANICAFGLDSRLTALAQKIGLDYTRYADDLVFSSHQNSLTRSFVTYVGAIVIEEGFDLNHRKTKLMNSASRQRIGGLVVNSKTNICRSCFDQMKAILFNCKTKGVEFQNLDGVANFRDHLQGRIAWIKYVNKNRGDQLQIMFDQIDW